MRCDVAETKPFATAFSTCSTQALQRGCDMVRLELWNGVRNDAERQGLLRLDGNLLKLPISNEIWEKASDLASRARNHGLTVPAADVLIFTCAIHYGLGIEHMDRHYDLLAAMPRN